MNPNTYESLRRPDPYEDRPVMRFLRDVLIVVYLDPMLRLIVRLP